MSEEALWQNAILEVARNRDWYNQEAMYWQTRTNDPQADYAQAHKYFLRCAAISNYYNALWEWLCGHENTPLSQEVINTFRAVYGLAKILPPYKPKAGDLTDETGITG